MWLRHSPGTLSMRLQLELHSSVKKQQKVFLRLLNFKCDSFSSFPTTKMNQQATESQ